MIQGGKKSLRLEEIIQDTLFMSKIFRNEFFNRDKRGLKEAARHRLEMLQIEKELTI